MPLNPNIILQGRGVQVSPIDIGATLAQVAQLQQGQQRLTLGELGLTQARQEAGQAEAQREAVRASIGPDGQLDYPALEGRLAQAGSLGGLAEIGKLRLGQQQGKRLEAQATQEGLENDALVDDYIHRVFLGVKAAPETYPQALAELQERLPASYQAGLQRIPGVYDERIVNAVLAKTANAKLVAAAKRGALLGTIPIYGRTKDGQPAIAQLSPLGPPQIAQFPQGFSPTPPPGGRLADTGTSLVPLDRAMQPTGPPIPIEREEAKRREKVGALSGEEEATRLKRAKETQRLIDNIELKHKGLLDEGGVIDQAITLAPAAGYWNRLNPLQLETRAQLEAMLERVKSVVGLEEMGTLRQAGGTLGPYTDRDLIALQSQIASFNLNLSPTQLKAQLEELRTTLKRQSANRERYFKEDFGIVDVSAPSGTPQGRPGAGSQLPRGMKKGELTEDRVRKLMDTAAKYGRPIPREEAISILQGEGYGN